MGLGGQEIYYTTHQFFLSPNCIYIIAFDCTKWNEKKNDFLFWLKSIQARAPGSKIIFVGTFLDKLKEDEREIPNISKDIDDIVSKWMQTIPITQQPRIQRCSWKGKRTTFWPINCRGNDKEDIDPLRVKYIQTNSIY